MNSYQTKQEKNEKIQEKPGSIHYNYSSTITPDWLKAPPIPNLGLAISQSEFIIVVGVWLGFPSFKIHSPSMCPCGLVVDPNGDHLLGCDHDPLRIRRHNALRDVLSRLLNNPSTRQTWAEDLQRFCNKAGWYLPWLHWLSESDGRQTSFDVSVVHTLSA